MIMQDLRATQSSRPASGSASASRSRHHGSLASSKYPWNKVDGCTYVSGLEPSQRSSGESKFLHCQQQEELYCARNHKINVMCTLYVYFDMSWK